MTARRRSRKRRRLLDDFADRSPMHALGVGALRGLPERSSVKLYAGTTEQFHATSAHATVRC